MRDSFSQSNPQTFLPETRPHLLFLMRTHVYLLYLTFTLFLSTGVTQASLPLNLVPTPPPIESSAYLLQDFDSDQILMEKQADKRLEPASLTKLMTAYLIFEKLKSGSLQLTEPVRISEKAWRTTGSRMYLNVNETVPVEQLLKGMIIQSGNDASIALAEHIAGSEETFVSLMNKKAQQLGLKNTHYTNSTGWPHSQQYTTAQDLARLAQTIIREHPEYYRWYSEREFTYNNITQTNRNLLLWRDHSVDGMKTGYTEAAGYCLVSSAKRGNMRLIAILMGAGNNKIRATESQKMLDYGFRFFETYLLYQAGQVLNTEKVWQGEQNHLTVGLTSDLYITLPKGQYQQLNASLHIAKRLLAPIKEGETLGTLRINLGEETLLERPLVALSSVNKGNLWKRLFDHLVLLFKK